MSFKSLKLEIGKKVETGAAPSNPLANSQGPFFSRD